MAINPNIALQVRAPEIESPLNALAKASQVKNAMNQNRLFDMQVAEKERTQQHQNALMQATRNAFDPETKRVNPDKYRGSLAEMGDYEGLQAFEKSQADQAKAEREAQKSKIETSLKQFEAIGQIMSGVRDQSSYDAARQSAAQILGPEAMANMPAAYDPAVIEQGRLKAMSVKDQMEQMWKKLDYDLNVDKFGETKRSNQVSEGISRGNLGVAQAGLSLRKEANDIARANSTVGKAPANYRYKPDGTLEAIPGGPADVKAGVEAAKKSSEARDVLGLLDEVDALLPKATGSYAGAGVDMALGAFGASTAGAQATAQLKALQGALVAKMPKMSGPQSDKDVLLYREMAGQVGDPTVPVKQRQAASKLIRKLNEKYAGMPEGSSNAKSNDGWSIVEVK